MRLAPQKCTDCFKWLNGGLKFTSSPNRQPLPIHGSPNRSPVPILSVCRANRKSADFVRTPYYRFGRATIGSPRPRLRPTVLRNQLPRGSHEATSPPLLGHALALLCPFPPRARARSASLSLSLALTSARESQLRPLSPRHRSAVHRRPPSPPRASPPTTLAPIQVLEQCREHLPWKSQNCPAIAADRAHTPPAISSRLRPN